MTSRAQPHKKKRAKAAPRKAPLWIPWVSLAVLAIVLLVLAWQVASPGALALTGPGSLWTRLTQGGPPQGDAPLSLRIIHSNDTYGYFLPCG